MIKLNKIYNEDCLEVMKINVKPIATPKYIRDINGMVALKEHTPVYTQEQMLKFAKEKCSELVNWYVESTGDVGHAVEMMIWFDGEFGDAEDD